VRLLWQQNSSGTNSLDQVVAFATCDEYDRLGTASQYYLIGSSRSLHFTAHGEMSLAVSVAAVMKLLQTFEAISRPI